MERPCNRQSEFTSTPDLNGAIHDPASTCSAAKLVTDEITGGGDHFWAADSIGRSSSSNSPQMADT